MSSSGSAAQGAGSTLTRQDLVEQLQASLGVPRSDATRLLEDLIGLVKEAALSRAGLKVANFGTFAVRHKKARVGRNPKTLAPVHIAERWVFVFHPSPVLRARLMGEGSDG